MNLRNVNMIVIVNEEKRRAYNELNVSTKDLIAGKPYEVIEKIDEGLYYKRYLINDETGEEYLYPQGLFDIVSD